MNEPLTPTLSHRERVYLYFSLSPGKSRGIAGKKPVLQLNPVPQGEGRVREPYRPSICAVSFPAADAITCGNCSSD